MRPAYELGREEGHDTKHALLLAAAIVLSLVLHIVFMRLIRDWQLNTTRVPKTEPGANEELSPLRVTTLEKDPIDPLKIFDRPATPSTTGIAGSDSPMSIGTLSLESIGELVRTPDTALTAPPPAPRATMRSENARIPAPELPPTDDNIWIPRQRIMEVIEFRVRDEVAELPRRMIPRIERIEAAPDYVPSAAVLKGERLSENSPVVTPSMIAAPEPAENVAPPSAVADADLPPVELPPQIKPAATSEAFGLEPGEVGDTKPLDERLKASLVTRRYADDPDTVYFRLAIDRRDAAELPVAPKDIVFAQDCSRSLALERLGFCRKAMVEALSIVGPQDRFNVAGFNDSVRLLFPDWATPSEESFSRAKDFIGAMKSEGETDVYASVEALLKLPRDPRRPLIILLVSDGRATVGPTQSTALIGELSRDNDGAVSIFTLGTHANANSYLLDMLAYCNRGESKVVATRRWDIPQAIESLAESLRRPVLSGVRFVVPAASEAQIFPRQASNLYADRPLQFYGAIPASEKDVLVQVLGTSVESDCDVLLQLPIAESIPASAAEDLRGSWARQRMYDLIGSYARTKDPALLSEMRLLSSRLRIPIPYQGEL